MSENISGRKTGWVYVLLTGVTVLVFWPAFHCDFVNYDDNFYLYQNPQVQGGVTSGSIAWAFKSTHASNWHPLTWISHMMDYELFGAEPGGHHGTSLLLHLANANLLLLVLYRMTGALWRSAFVAGLFALHPLHVESVVWLSERKDVLSAFFCFLTLLAYTRYVKEPKLTSYLVVLVLFACGLMSKPMVVTLPFLLLLLDFWPLRRLRLDGTSSELSPASQVLSQSSPGSLRLVLLEKLPLLCLSAGSSMITLWAQSRTVMPFHALPFYVRVCNAILSYGRYIYKTIWPAKLAVFYPYWGIMVIGQIVLVAAVLVIVTVTAVKRLRMQPYLAVGWFWYLGMLVPVIGLVQVGLQSIADRYTYIPMIGLLVALAWGAYDLTRAWTQQRLTLAGAGLAVLIGCAMITPKQAEVWHDSVSLFQHAIKVTAPNAVAHYNLGVSLLERGNMDAARDHFYEGVRINPALPEIHNNLANILSIQGKNEEAVEQYSEALKYSPTHVIAHYNLGLTLAELGRLDEAIKHYEEALRLRPQMVQVHKDLAVALEEKKEFESALLHFREMVRLQPSNGDALFALACCLKRSGNEQEATQRLADALHLKPNLLQEYNANAQALAQKGKTEDAIKTYLAVLTVDSQNVEAREQLGLLLARLNRVEEALPHFLELARLRPDARSQYHLALSYSIAGKYTEAVQHYRQALQLNPDWPTALNDLAWILATNPQANLRNGIEAVQLAERACELSERKQPQFLGTLDAAYAEAGRFADALSTAARARELALSLGNKEVAEAAEKRMALYRAAQPFHLE